MTTESAPENTPDNTPVSAEDAAMIEELHKKFMLAQAAVGELRLRHLDEEAQMVNQFGEAQKALKSALDFIAKRHGVDTSGAQQYHIPTKSFRKA